MRTKPRTRDALAELIAEKGELHEARYLEHLRAAGREVVEIELPVGPDAFPQAHVATVAAMRSSVELIYQATFAREGWRSRADFVVRVGEPSMLGSWSYEPYDTKLARTAKPAAVLPLAWYAGEIGVSADAGLEALDGASRPALGRHAGPRPPCRSSRKTRHSQRTTERGSGRKRPLPSEIASSLRAAIESQRFWPKLNCGLPTPHGGLC
jgi:hypothetical protein